MNNNKFCGSVQLTFLVSGPVVVGSMVYVCVCVRVYGWVGGCVCGYVCVCVWVGVGVNHVKLDTCHC